MENKREDKFKICKGCRTNINYRKDIKDYGRVCLINYPVLSETKQCPCITCLIKGMCLSGCDDYRRYANLVKRRLYNDKTTL